jgi:ABC-type transporter Mla subunit MlaD
MNHVLEGSGETMGQDKGAKREGVNASSSALPPPLTEQPLGVPGSSAGAAISPFPQRSSLAQALETLPTSIPAAPIPAWPTSPLQPPSTEGSPGPTRGPTSGVIPPPLNAPQATNGSPSAAKSHIPNAASAPQAEAPSRLTPNTGPDAELEPAPPQRRQAKRKPAGAPASPIAANDDVPSIGGLIYALERKPSNRPFVIAAGASGVWFAVGLLFAWGMLAPEIAKLTSVLDVFTRPSLLIVVATIALPILLFWFLAQLVWRTQELRLMSSAMTEVAVRLAEPDRHAEQSAASLGQAVRKQVTFMNDAVSRALGRAGELETMVHNEVATLERSYVDNEQRIRGLIQELAGERHALSATSDNMHGTLKSIGSEVPALIEKLSGQQIKLAKIIEGAGQNLLALESSLNKASGSLETNLGERTTHLQSVLEDYSATLNTTLADRTGHLQSVLDGYTEAISGALGNRTNEIQSVFETYTQALDTTMSMRTHSLDSQLVERTRVLDDAFTQRLQLFDDSITRSTLAIDGAVGEKARALSVAMENHAQQLSETLGRQAVNLDETLMHGINAVRRTSETITRQSVKAIEGLAGHTDLLKNVSDNLLTQINGVTNRFESQGQTIMRAAGALEQANYKIDSTLQNRHRELTDTLGKMSIKADQLDGVMRDYSSSIEGTITEAEARTRMLTQQMSLGAATQSQAALAELERMKRDTEAQTDRALEDMRHRFSTVSSEVSTQMGSLTSRLAETADDIRARTQSSAADFAAEQARLRAEADRLPQVARANADSMRSIVQEQLRALDQLSTFTDREAAYRQVAPPVPLVEMPRTQQSAHYAPPPTYAPPPPQHQAQPVYTPPPQPAPQMNYAVPPQSQYAPVQAAQSAQQAQQARWSLGDLLARASEGDGSGARASASSATGAINIDSISRALDPATASAIWSRLRSGQRGIMVRSIYSAEGRTSFDEISRRCATEPDFRATVDRFLGDFEVMLRDAEQKDPSGRMLQGNLVSNSGRVYLFLAHASGRLT